MDHDPVHLLLGAWITLLVLLVWYLSGKIDQIQERLDRELRKP